MKYAYGNEGADWDSHPSFNPSLTVPMNMTLEAADDQEIGSYSSLPSQPLEQSSIAYVGPAIQAQSSLSLLGQEFAPLAPISEQTSCPGWPLGFVEQRPPARGTNTGDPAAFGANSGDTYRQQDNTIPTRDHETVSPDNWDPLGHDMHPFLPDDQARFNNRQRASYTSPNLNHGHQFTSTDLYPGGGMRAAQHSYDYPSGPPPLSQYNSSTDFRQPAMSQLIYGMPGMASSLPMQYDQGPQATQLISELALISEQSGQDLDGYDASFQIANTAMADRSGWETRNDRGDNESQSAYVPSATPANATKSIPTSRRFPTASTSSTSPLSGRVTKPRASRATRTSRKPSREASSHFWRPR